MTTADPESDEAESPLRLNSGVSALKQAIALNSPAETTVEVVTSMEMAQLFGLTRGEGNVITQDVIWCPLTLDVPHTIEFPGRNIFQACRDLAGRREWVRQTLGYATNEGQFGLDTLYLPIVWTAKGPLYGEVIERNDQKSDRIKDSHRQSPPTTQKNPAFLLPTPHSSLNTQDSGLSTPDYSQILNVYSLPVPLADNQRQLLYHLAYQLLRSLSAPPAVYLLQFGYNQQDIVFDRLWPFPAAPAIASLGVQSPDLFTCHWYCLIGQPIFDLTIVP